MPSSVSDARSKSFVLTFLATFLIGIGIAEWVSRAKVVRSFAEARRAEEVYRSPLNSAIFGDSQMYAAFAPYRSIYSNLPRDPEFEMMALSGESMLMVEVLVTEYFRFRRPDKVILPVGPQFFAANRLARGHAGYDTYFGQNNWLQHHVRFVSYFAEPGIGGFTTTLLVRNVVSQQESAPIEREGCRISPAERRWTDYSPRCRAWLATGRVAGQRPINGFETSPDFAAFVRLARALKSKGAQLCFVRPPVSEEFEMLTREDVQYQIALRKMWSLADELGARKVHYKSLPSIEQQAFLNQDHIAPEGAKLFAMTAIAKCFSDQIPTSAAQ